MTIVYCLHSLHKAGGIERVTTTKANYLAQLGHSVHIITTDQRDSIYAFELHSNVIHYDLGLNYEKDNDLGRLGRYWALYKKKRKHKALLVELLGNIKPDVVVSTFFQDSNILGEIDLKELGGGVKILELHSTKNTKVLMYPKEQKILRLIGKIRIWFDELIVKKYDCFVVLCEEEKEYWKNTSNIAVISNPIPFIANERATLDSPRIIALGRYCYQKNFSDLIYIFSNLAHRYPDWRLSIYGAGQELPLLKKLSQELGVEGRVDLIFTSDAQAAYRTGSIYAMTSRYEGFPMVLLEAQEMGLPIVSYTCPEGPRALVKDGVNGFLVPVGNREVFINSLERLMKDESLRRSMGNFAQLNAKKYRVEDIMQRWLVLFDNLLNNKQSRL